MKNTTDHLRGLHPFCSPRFDRSLSWRAFEILLGQFTHRRGEHCGMFVIRDTRPMKNDWPRLRSLHVIGYQASASVGAKNKERRKHFRKCCLRLGYMADGVHAQHLNVVAFKGSFRPIPLSEELSKIVRRSRGHDRSKEPERLWNCWCLRPKADSFHGVGLCVLGERQSPLTLARGRGFDCGLKVGSS